MTTPIELPALAETCPACDGGADPELLDQGRAAMAEWLAATRHARSEFADKRKQDGAEGNPWDQAAWASSSEYARAQAARPAAVPPVGCEDCRYVGAIPTGAGLQLLEFLSVHGPAL